PGQDHAHGAEGLAAREGMIGGADVDHLAVKRIDEAAIDLEVLRRDLDLERRLPCRLAGLTGLDGGKRRAVLTYLARHFEEHASALDRAAIAPCREGFRGGLNGLIDIAAVTCRHGADFLRRARIETVDIKTGTRRHERPADEMIQSFLHRMLPDLRGPADA